MCEGSTSVAPHLFTANGRTPGAAAEAAAVLAGDWLVTHYRALIATCDIAVEYDRAEGHYVCTILILAEP